MSRPIAAAVLAGSLLFVACGDDSPVSPGPNPSPALRVGAWHLQHAEGQALPAMIAHRMLPGNVLEQTFVDSSRLDVTADGRYEQRTWMRVYHNLEYEHDHERFDSGTWTATADGFAFQSALRPVSWIMRQPRRDSARLVQPMLSQEGAGVVDAVFRETRPARGLVDRWKGAFVDNRALPAVVISQPLDEYEGAPASTHLKLDSVVVELHPTQRYRMVEFVSWWIGPPGGQPTQRIYGTRFTDWGAWREIGGQLQFSSTLYQNRGWFGQQSPAGGALLLPQPIAQDDLVGVRTVTYLRQ